MYLPVDPRRPRLCEVPMMPALASADLPAYEAAQQFIKVSNLLRLYQQLGWDVPWSLQQDLMECRYRLDRVLRRVSRPRSDAEWDVVVRTRLTGKGKRTA
jgi:hypothetical protein